jgi:HPt (histidine-containing phosphotransfer) domain-containing protein
MVAMDSRPFKVLLVAGDSDDAGLFREMLDRADTPEFKLTRLPRLDEALERLPVERHQVVVLDVEFSGSAVPDALREVPGDGGEGRPVSESEGPADPVYDRETALSRVEGDDVVELFLEEAPGLLAGIRASMGRGDGPGLMRAAHKLKGAAGSLAANGAVHAAQALEMLGAEGNLAGAGEEYGRLEREIGRLRRALRSPSRRHTPVEATAAPSAGPPPRV